MKNNITRSNNRLNTEMVGNGMQKKKSPYSEDPNWNQPHIGLISFKKRNPVMEDEKKNTPIIEIKNLLSEREKEIDKNIIEGICKIAGRRYDQLTQDLKRPYSTNQSLFTSFALFSAVTNHLRRIIDDCTEGLSEENVDKIESYILASNSDTPPNIVNQSTVEEIKDTLIEMGSNINNLWSKISEMLLIYSNEGDRSIVKNLLEQAITAYKANKPSGYDQAVLIILQETLLRFVA